MIMDSGKQSKEPNSETNLVLTNRLDVCCSDPTHITIKMHKISLTVTELWPVNECLENIL